MDASIFNFTEEPSGDLYRALLDACLEFCRLGLLVERESLGLAMEGKRVLERLRPWIQEEEQLSEWPGTTLHGHSAMVRTFAFNRDSAGVLKDSVSGLFEWRQPEYPEDLCLLRADGRPWLISIAHEYDAYLKISEEERDGLVGLLPELAEKLRYS